MKMDMNLRKMKRKRRKNTLMMRSNFVMMNEEQFELDENEE